MDELSLVTGGAGFIGSHLVDELVRRGKPVRILDDFSTGLHSNLEHLEGQIEIVTGSLVDASAVQRAMHGVGVVYHLGALASVARSVENPLATHAACVTGTLNLLDAARRVGVRRVVYAGSSSAYGGSQPTTEWENRKSLNEHGQSEDQLPCARSPYAAAKLAGELYMQAFAATYGIETVRLRFFNIFGPRQRSDSPYSGVIALFIAAMTRSESPSIHGDGSQSRDFTYVANAVHALLKAAEMPEVSGKVFNVGTGRTVTVLQLYRQLQKILDSEVEPVMTASRAGDVKFSRADIRRTRQELGYEPLVSFEDGLRLTVEWYLESIGSFHQLQKA